MVKKSSIRTHFTVKKSYETRSKRKLDEKSKGVECYPAPLVAETKKGKIETKGKITKSNQKLMTEFIQVIPKNKNVIEEEGNEIIEEDISNLPYPAISSVQKNVLPTKVIDTLPTPASNITEEIKIDEPLKNRIDEEVSANEKLVTSEEHKLEAPKIKSGIAIPAYMKYVKLTNPNQILLPSHMEGLYKNFWILLHTMYYNKVYNGAHIFHHLKPAVESSSKRTFNIADLAKYHTLLPDLFVFEHVKTLYQHKQIDSLSIKVPSLGLGIYDKSNKKVGYPKEEIDNYCKQLRNKLINLVHQEHNEFLVKRGLQSKPSVPSKWHPSFELNLVKEVEEAETPLTKNNDLNNERFQVLTSLSERVGNLIKNNRIDNKSYGTNPAELLERAKALCAKKPELTEYKKVDYKEELRLRKESIVKRQAELKQKIKEREIQNNLNKSQLETNLKKEDLTKKAEQLSSIVKSIKVAFFMNHGAPVMPLNNLVNKVMPNSAWKLSNEEIKDRIKLLETIVPDFIKLALNPNNNEYYITLKDKNLTLDYIQGKLDDFVNKL